MMQPLEPLHATKQKRGVKFKQKTSDNNLDKIEEESPEAAQQPPPVPSSLVIKRKKASSKYKITSADVVKALESKGDPKGIASKWNIARTRKNSSSSSKPLHRPFEKILKGVSEPITGGIGRRLYEKDEIFGQHKYGEECAHKKPKSLKEVQRHPQAFGIWDRVYDLSVIETLPPIRKDHIAKPSSEEEGEEEKIPEYEGYADVVRLRDNHDETRCYLSSDEFDWCLEHTNFKGNEIIAWYKRFRKDCPHGLLSKSHLTRLCKQMLPFGNGDAFVNHIFRIFDNDNNGHLDFMEFLMAMDMTKCESAEERLKWAFKMYDVDGNGEIDLKELTTIIDIIDQLEGQKGGYKNSKKKAKEIYDLMDLNHDGSVSLEEFIKYSDLIDSVRNQNHTAIHD